ncbi:MAG TPA: hypothetical protein VMH87_07190 [Pseudomonadales bacterium]|nr:hypothetical protein [Pseudomonadales bacterium]
MKNDHYQTQKAFGKKAFVNLARYKPSQVYFAKLRVKGKPIRRGAKSNPITVAKFRLEFHR